MERDPADLYRESNEAEWNDIRHRRVLDNVHAAMQDPPSETAHRRPPSWRTGVVALVAAAAAFSLFWGSRTRPSPSPASGVADVAQSARVMLSSDVEAELLSRAEVRLADRTDRLVSVVQARGEVRYRVKPDRSRTVEVQIEGVVVRVIGTVFNVQSQDRIVHVSVARGTVQVTHAGGVSLLTTGQQGEFLGVHDRHAKSPTPVAEQQPPVPETAPKPERATATRPDTQSRSAASPPAELMTAADEARAQGDDSTAMAKLQTLLRAHPSDLRATTARFTLGRLYAKNGQHARAAKEFERVFRGAPDGPLAEDAMAEHAISLDRAGLARRASKAATEYIERFPEGPHAGRLRALVASPPE